MGPEVWGGTLGGRNGYNRMGPMIRHLRWAVRPHERVSHRRAWAGVVTFLVVSVTAWFIMVDRAKYLVRELLVVSAAVSVTEASRGAYRLDVSGVDFKWWRRSVSVGAVHLTTNSAVNATRSSPLPETRIALSDCAIRGVHLLTLIASRGLSAETMGCRSVVVDATLLKAAEQEERAHDRPMRERPAGKGFLVLQRRIELPRAVPRLRIRKINFPHSSVRFSLARAGKAPLTVELDRFRWFIDDVEVDPSDSAAVARPLFSRAIHVAATDFTAMTDSNRIIRVGRMQASLTDSLIELRDVSYVKNVGRTTAGLAIHRAAALGIDVGTFAAGEGIEARRIVVDSMDLALTIHKTRRAGARPRRRENTPQQWIRSEVGNLAVDTLTLNGSFTLNEIRPGVAPARLRFGNLEVVAANVRHVTGRTTRDDAMTVALSTRFQNAAVLRARFEIPLDAPRGDMRYTGSLGSMDARVLNQFVERAAGVRITSGRVTGGIRFDVTVRNGVARGTVTPLYDQLRIKVVRKEGRGGILGSRGTLGAIARRFASFVANERMVRDDNPDEPGDPIRVGRVYRVRRSDEKLPGFIWGGLKDALLSVIRK